MRPIADPTPDTAGYFAAIDRGEFLVPQCADCRRFFLYPRPICPHCAGRNVSLQPVSGRGHVESFVVNHRPPPGFDADGPYVVALVKLDEGPVLLTNVTTADGRPMSLDLPVRAVFREAGERMILEFTEVEAQ